MTLCGHLRLGISRVGVACRWIFLSTAIRIVFENGIIKKKESMHMPYPQIALLRCSYIWSYTVCTSTCQGVEFEWIVRRKRLFDCVIPFTVTTATPRSSLSSTALLTTVCTVGYLLLLGLYSFNKSRGSSLSENFILAWAIPWAF